MRDLSAVVDGERLGTYSRLLVACYGILLLALLVLSSGNVGPDGKPIGADFITFWSAGRLTLAGNAAGAFDADTIFAMQRVAAPAYNYIFLWHYPPTFQLAAAVLAVPPYLVSYYLFVGASLALFIAAVRPMVPWREAGILLLALPATLTCVLHGQNSLVSAALLATAIMSIERRPVLAGVCIGLLAYKPQLGVLFPLVLAMTGHWKVMGVAAVTLAVFVGLSMAAFGFELWAVFLGNLAVVREVVESGQLPWGKMPSAFVFLRKLGVPQTFAYAGQVVVAAGVVAVVTMVWWRRGATLMAGAVLVSGTMLLTPYTFDYEMAIMAVPLAVIARHLVRHGASEGEKLLLGALAAAPLAMGPLVDKCGIQLGFLALAAMFVWTARLALVPRAVAAKDIPVEAAGSSLVTSR